jgi:hypothetical protein
MSATLCGSHRGGVAEAAAYIAETVSDDGMSVTFLIARKTTGGEQGASRCGAPSTS